MTSMLQHTVGYLPYHQPLAVITASGVLLAANRPFLDLLGTPDDELLGADWDDFMPGWSMQSGVDAGGVARGKDARVEDPPDAAGRGSLTAASSAQVLHNPMLRFWGLCRLER